MTCRWDVTGKSVREYGMKSGKESRRIGVRAACMVCCHMSQSVELLSYVGTASERGEIGDALFFCWSIAKD